jgi:hypothetical protein
VARFVNLKRRCSTIVYVRVLIHTPLYRYPTKPVQKAWPKDVKLFRVFKDWSKAAVLQCGLLHRERRAYLLGELEVIERLVAACPGLAAPKAPLCLAALALGVDEAKWQLRHANAMPRCVFWGNATGKTHR